MVDTTSTRTSNRPVSDLSEAGTPDEALIQEVEQTIMGFRLEDFDPEELRQCALAVLEVAVRSCAKRCAHRRPQTDGKSDSEETPCAPDVLITAEMIVAGMDARAGYNPDFDCLEDVIREIYRAMFLSSPAVCELKRESGDIP